MKLSITAAFTALLAAVSALPTIGSRPAPEGGRKVFAHYMLGLTANQTPEYWAQDIRDAKASGIDGFALNAGPKDAWSLEQLQFAYDMAEAEGNFSLFISFDMNPDLYTWEPSVVAEWISQYKDSPAQFHVDGKPFVSTFEGVPFADQWPAVEAQTGDLYLVPDWSSIGPDGVSQHFDKIDGAFSWDAWSKTKDRKSLDSDTAYTNVLGGDKSYMMGVSPNFYTNVPQYNKNWLWASDQLWFDRWNQVLEVMPEFVEIITWNDFGESHYIGSQMRDEAVVENSERYVKGVPHEALRDVLPYYIASYKAGAAVPVEEDLAVFWYRNAPKDVGDSLGTTCGQGDGAIGPATDCLTDSVFVLALSAQAQTVKVEIGGQGEEFQVEAGPQLVELPFNGRTGEVKVTLASGASSTGPVEIKNEAPEGKANFNYFTASTKNPVMKALPIDEGIVA